MNLNVILKLNRIIVLIIILAVIAGCESTPTKSASGSPNKNSSSRQIIVKSCTPNTCKYSNVACYTQRAKVCEKEGNLESAATSYRLAKLYKDELRLNKVVCKQNKVAHTCNAVAKHFEKIGNPTESKKYYKFAADFYYQDELYINSIKSYRKAGELSEALNIAKSLCNENRDTFSFYGETCSIAGDILKAKGKPKHSYLDYYKKELTNIKNYYKEKATNRSKLRRASAGLIGIYRRLENLKSKETMSLVYFSLNKPKIFTNLVNDSYKDGFISTCPYVDNAVIFIRDSLAYKNELKKVNSDKNVKSSHTRQKSDSISGLSDSLGSQVKLIEALTGKSTIKIYDGMPETLRAAAMLINIKDKYCKRESSTSYY